MSSPTGPLLNSHTSPLARLATAQQTQHGPSATNRVHGAAKYNRAVWLKRTNAARLLDVHVETVGAQRLTDRLRDLGCRTVLSAVRNENPISLAHLPKLTLAEANPIRAFCARPSTVVRTADPPPARPWRAVAQRGGCCITPRRWESTTPTRLQRTQNGTAGRFGSHSSACLPPDPSGGGLCNSHRD